MKKNSFLCATVIISLFAFIGCEKTDTSPKKIAVFVPGNLAGSPVYEMLAAGATEAVTDYNAAMESKNNSFSPVEITVIEAGTNQAEWSNKLTALCATSEYDVIISSNPSLPDLAAPLTEQFPSQKFILLDGYYPNNSNITTVRYNQREQGFLAGYVAGLVTTASVDEMKYANKELKVALLAAQEYPVMNEIILPSFIEGAKYVNKDIQVEFRVVGNWYDAIKGADLARSLYNSGVDVILPICGGASQGVFAAAKELGFYITWFDDNGFGKAPGYVVSSAGMKQKQMAYEQTYAFLENKTEFGTARTVGIADGYVEFILDDPILLETVPATLLNQMNDIYKAIQSGKIVLNVE